jgi:hypothetical protein
MVQFKFSDKEYADIYLIYGCCSSNQRVFISKIISDWGSANKTTSSTVRRYLQKIGVFVLLCIRMCSVFTVQQIT